MKVVPATIDRFDDLVHALGMGGGACWCMYYRMSATDYGRHSGDDIPAQAERRSALMRVRCASAPAPGMLAYLDGEAVGWCGVSPRPEFVRLVRSRTIPSPPEPEYWTVVCFLVRAGFRRQGVASALLEGAVDYARRCGAPGVEGYPVDAGAKRLNTASAYVGTVSMFEAAGFRRVTETSATSTRLPRWVMRYKF